MAMMVDIRKADIWYVLGDGARVVHFQPKGSVPQILSHPIVKISRIRIKLLLSCFELATNLFTRRTLHRVQYTIITHSRETSLVTTSPCLVQNVQRYFYMRGNKIHHNLLKEFNPITRDISSAKYLWFRLFTWRNRIVLDLKSISVPFTRARSNFCVKVNSHVKYSKLYINGHVRWIYHTILSAFYHDEKNTAYYHNIHDYSISRHRRDPHSS